MAEDWLGFPCALTARQQSRLRVRRFTATSKWALLHPTLASALSAPLAGLRELVVVHGFLPAYRPALWTRLCDAVRGAPGPASSARPYADLVRTKIPAAVARQSA